MFHLFLSEILYFTFIINLRLIKSSLVGIFNPVEGPCDHTVDLFFS